MLGRRRRRRANIKPTLGQRLCLLVNQAELMLRRAQGKYITPFNYRGDILPY